MLNTGCRGPNLQGGSVMKDKTPKHERIAAMMRESNCQYFFQHPEVYLISFDGGTNRTLICAFDDFECIRLQVELYREKGNG